jgi:hypothetical protein
VLFPLSLSTPLTYIIIVIQQSEGKNESVHGEITASKRLSRSPRKTPTFSAERSLRSMLFIRIRPVLYVYLYLCAWHIMHCITSNSLTSSQTDLTFLSQDPLNLIGSDEPCPSLSTFFSPVDWVFKSTQESWLSGENMEV